MKKKLFAIVLCTLLLTGCWDKRELNEIGIVSAFGLDKDKSTGEFIMTTQIIKVAALKSDTGGSGQTPVLTVTARGKTIFEAIRNISQELDKRAYYPHCKVIVISEEIAKDGITPIMDFFMRSQEIRNEAWLIVAKGISAREVLGAEHGIERVQGNYLALIIKNRILHSEASASTLLEFIKRMPGSGINPITGAFQLTENAPLPIENKTTDTSNSEAGITLLGTEVFKKDKLVGYLDGVQTRGLNWITGQIKSGVINVPSPNEKGKLIAIEIKSASSSIKPKIKGGKLLFTINVKEEGNIVNLESLTDISKVVVYKEIEKEQTAFIKKEIIETIEFVQSQLDSDIFGFGSALYRKYPKEWAKVKDDWDSLFPNVEYKVNVESRIKNPGQLLKQVVEEKKGPEKENNVRNRTKENWGE